MTAKVPELNVSTLAKAATPVRLPGERERVKGRVGWPVGHNLFGSYQRQPSLYRLSSQAGLPLENRIPNHIRLYFLISSTCYRNLFVSFAVMPTATESSQSLQAPALPSEILMVAETQWLFTEAELLRTPSILDGLTPEKERENRSKGVNFILQVGIMLKLPQITLATASVFLHRFYMRHSMQTYHYYSMAATCLFLAYKVEECVRKMRELVVACVRVAQKDPHKTVDEQDKEYWRWRDNILQYEDLLLEAICFDLSLEPPYKTLFDLLVQFEQGENKKLRNAAWAFVNDSCLTTLCLLFPSRTIAASALYAAAKFCDVAFPDDARGRPWWEVNDVDVGSIRRACNYMASIYENGPAKNAGKEVGMYERTPEDGNEREDKTRSAGGAHKMANDDGGGCGHSSNRDNSNDGPASPTPIAPSPGGNSSQAGYKRGHEETETEQQRPSATNGAAPEANGKAPIINQDGSRKRQKVNEETTLRNGSAPAPPPPPPQQGQARIPHRPTTAPSRSEQQQPPPAAYKIDRAAAGTHARDATGGGGGGGGGLESPDLEENNGSEEGEVEA